MSQSHRRLFALLAAPFLVACASDPIDLPPVEEVGHPFVYTAPSGAPEVTSVSVRGTFNEWAETPMTLRQDGSWRVAIELGDGIHEYKYYINETWPNDMCHDQTWGQAASDFWVDPAADGCSTDGHGGQNAVLVLGDVPALMFSHDPAASRYVSAAGGALSIRFRARTGQAQWAAVLVGQDTFPMHVQYTIGLHDVWRAAVPTGTAGYTLAVATSDGNETFGPYTAPADPFTAVEWVGSSVGYQIFPERFWNGDPSNDSMALATDSWHFKQTGGTQPYLTPWDGAIGNSHCCHQYFGGDLQGVIDRLDHLEEMGVTFLYLNPIFTSGSAHGYDASSFTEVAPNFGDEAVLQALLDAATARGMRLMWDFVPNHVGVGFWAFQDAVENGPESDYWGWFNFHVPHNQIVVGNGNHYDAWWGLGSLPMLETRNTEVFDHLMDVTRHWTEFGLHGIRVDVPEEIRNRAAFFSAFREAAKAVNPDVYLVAEVWHRDPQWVRGDWFDSLMNYALGRDVVQRFALGQLTGPVAQQDMARLYADYPEASAAMQFNLISSHDTSRLLTLLGGGNMGATPSATAIARQRLATALLYALPGVPITFQGDECAYLGGTLGGDDQHRYPIQWGTCDADTFEHYRQLAALRGDAAAIRSPVIRHYHAEGPVLSFYRGEPGPDEVIAAFSNSASAQQLPLPAGEWIDAATGESFTGSAPLSGYGWRWLRRG